MISIVSGTYIILLSLQSANKMKSFEARTQGLHTWSFHQFELLFSYSSYSNPYELLLADTNLVHWKIYVERTKFTEPVVFHFLKIPKHLHPIIWDEMCNSVKRQNAKPLGKAFYNTPYTIWVQLPSHQLFYVGHCSHLFKLHGYTNRLTFCFGSLNVK